MFGFQEDGVVFLVDDDEVGLETAGTRKGVLVCGSMEGRAGDTYEYRFGNVENAVLSPVISFHFLRISSQEAPPSRISMSILSCSAARARVLAMGRALRGLLLSC